MAAPERTPRHLNWPVYLTGLVPFVALFQLVGVLQAVLIGILLGSLVYIFQRLFGRYARGRARR